MEEDSSSNLDFRSQSGGASDRLGRYSILQLKKKAKKESLMMKETVDKLATQIQSDIENLVREVKKREDMNLNLFQTLERLSNSLEEEGSDSVVKDSSDTSLANADEESARTQNLILLSKVDSYEEEIKQLQNTIAQLKRNKDSANVESVEIKRVDDDDVLEKDEDTIEASEDPEYKEEKIFVLPDINIVKQEVDETDFEDSMEIESSATAFATPKGTPRPKKRARYALEDFVSPQFGEEQVFAEDLGSIKEEYDEDSTETEDSFTMPAGSWGSGMKPGKVKMMPVLSDKEKRALNKKRPTKCEVEYCEPCNNTPNCGVCKNCLCTTKKRRCEQRFCSRFDEKRRELDRMMKAMICGFCFVKFSSRTSVDRHQKDSCPAFVKAKNAQEDLGSPQLEQGQVFAEDLGSVKEEADEDLAQMEESSTMPSGSWGSGMVMKMMPVISDKEKQALKKKRTTKCEVEDCEPCNTPTCGVCKNCTTSKRRCELRFCSRFDEKRREVDRLLKAMVCGFCFGTFSSRNSVDRHMKESCPGIMNDKKNIFCRNPNCGFVAHSPLEMRDHIEGFNHRDGVAWQCQFCSDLHPPITIMAHQIRCVSKTTGGTTGGVNN